MNSSLEKEFHNILGQFQKSSSLKEQSLNPEQEHLIHHFIQNNSSSEYSRRILSEFSGYGPLDSILNKSHITEIIINNKESIFYEENGFLKKHQDYFLSDITFNNIVEKICSEARINTNYKKPFAEGRWKDFRLHVTRPPIVKKDFHMSFRKHPKNTWTLEKLLEHRWASEAEIEIIKDILKQKLNVLIVGPTNSGKTSVLNACLQELSKTERVISIEDTDEIVLPNQASVKLLTQSSVEESLSVITQQDLLKESLRLRPDRLVLGEVRGEEAKNLLLALSSGHRGSMGTIHAQTHKQALSKLEMLIQMGASQWQSSMIKKLIFFGLQILIVVEKIGSERQLKGIYKIDNLESSGFLFETLIEKKGSKEFI